MTEIADCLLCTSPTSEIKCVLFSMKKKLKQLLNEYVPDFKEQDFKEPKNHHSFINLVKITFGNESISKTPSNQCNHQKICRYMKRKFKCDSITFQQLCDRLVSTIGERNYQFQVLNSQIKSLSDTTMKVFNQVKTQSKSQVGTLETIQIKEERIKQKKKLIEICENQQKYKGQINNQQQNNGQQIQAINLSYQYFYPYGFYLSEFSSNPNHSP